MNKFISLMPFLIAMGCVTQTPPSNATLQTYSQLISQRDLQNPAIALTGGGFVTAEAKQMLEFCIELNNQDSRASSTDPQFEAKPVGWNILFDSRHPGNTEWNKKWATTPTDPNSNNPEKNGFGPFNNAWLLLRSELDPSQYAIAIRGTVGEARSIIADALITTIPAQAGIKLKDGRLLPISFSATPKAELHLGFAYAAFTLLFEKERGILQQLHNANLPKDTKLFITGHSQGAAIATLIHSFLYYAMTDPADRYKLNLQLKPSSHNSGGILLKSYLFAQPKPGNLQYAEDFARIAKDASYAVNNDLDPVPQVPLSLQVPSEVVKGVADENKGKGSLLNRVGFDGLKAITDFNQLIRNKIAKRGEDHVAKRFDEVKVNLDLHYFAGSASPEPLPATSLNYTLAGQLIPLFGLDKGGTLYPPTSNKPDVLLQHHATSYRKLMEKQIP